MNRRNFIKDTSKFALLLSMAELGLLPELKAAESSDEFFFVQINFSGGWDVTLGLDPWLKSRPDEKEMFIEYDPTQIIQENGIAFGPSLLKLRSFSKQMCVINGIFLSANDNGHDAAQKYMHSGSTNQAWGDLAVEILENRESGLLGIATNRSVNLASRNQLVTQLSTLSTLAANSSHGFQSPQNNSNLLSKIERSLGNSQKQIDQLAEQVKKFRDSGEQIGEFHYLAALLSSGLSNTAVLSLDNNLDTHSDHVGQHLQKQDELWQKTAQIFEIFKKVEHPQSSGKSLFDQTTFYITSEFSRTAALNSSNGKDHNPLTNSALLVGPNIRGGLTIGGSNLITQAQSKTKNSYHIASPVNINTGKAISQKQDAMIIKPEHIAATIIESLGISRNRFASVSPKIPSLKWALK